MIDKVQKIREEVERLMNELIREKEKGFGSDTDDACILELQNVLTYIDSLQEEPVSEDLKEAAMQYGTDEFPSLCNGCKHIPVDAFKAGAKWQKEQLMKNVIDARVIDTKGNYPSLAYGHIDMMFALEDMKVAEGDKVKLIIIKGD